MKRKTNEPIDAQYDINGTVYLSKNKTVKTISFYRAFIKEKPQLSFFDKISIDKVFDQNLQLAQYQIKNETINPNFTQIFKNDKYVFLSYQNRRNLEKDSTRLFHNNNIVPHQEEYSFEYFTFILFEFQTNHIAVINQRNTTSWKDSLEKLFNNYNFFCKIEVYQDSDLFKSLGTHNIKGIEFTTLSKELISKNQLYGELGAEGIEKISVSLQIKGEESSKYKNIIKKEYSTNIDKYSSLKVLLEDEIIDLTKNKTKKEITIYLPKTFNGDSVYMEGLRNIMLTELHKYFS